MSDQQKLGEPLPQSKHAVSVSLPKWDDVIGYEEGNPRVINAMKTGYPRFVYNAITKKLFAEAEKKFAGENEFCLVFPSERIAKICVAFSLRQWNEQNNTKLNHQPLAINKYAEGIWAVSFPVAFQKIAKAFWQHPGYIVSSRQAEAALEKRADDKPAGNAAKAKIKQQLSTLTGEVADNIYLFPSGMAAIFSAFESSNEGATVQLGFPYVDTLKIQEKFGHETIFLPYKSAADLDELQNLLDKKKISAVFTEFPCNPLITCVDLEKLSKICRASRTALIIDDTLSTWANADLRPYADIIVSSLTKFFSGIGDVLGGSLVLNSTSPLFSELKSKIDNNFEDLLFGEDAIVLEKNSRDFETRITQVNENAEKLYDWLSANYKNISIFYTKGNPVYEKYKRAGYGGIISLVLETPEKAQKFFDNIDIKKGPSLGTNYTLACPYTMLAHYTEREFAETAGVPFHLVRISVGLEDFSELKLKFERALAL